MMEIYEILDETREYLKKQRDLRLSMYGFIAENRDAVNILQEMSDNALEITSLFVTLQQTLMEKVYLEGKNEQKR